MCFSAQGDLAAGVIVTGIGVDAWFHLRGRNTHLLLATVPVVLGLHQLDESLVWLSLQGDVPHSVGRLATWVYLVVALIVVPVMVPLAILRLEPTVRRRRFIAPFVGLGLALAVLLSRIAELVGVRSPKM
ncbi:MAG TPA: DUF6629 family protein [Acidimicrobiales bacterium]|nr:DUF6629 family protein [Acidimicrobiales bacterium]